MSNHFKQHIIVGMSGGVDSSVAALQLLRQGYRVEGLFMKNWEEDDSEGYCAAEQDLADAQAVCDRLGINLHRVNFSHDYWERVFKHFLREYQAGRTPNPDVLCNKEIKFKAFLDYALDLGAYQIATGHYVKSDCRKGLWSMYTATDKNKDQSYFLYSLGQKELSRTLFPLGGLLKQEVRLAAHEAGLPNHSKKDSTGICFIGERRFRDFLSRFLDTESGDIVTVEGDLVGRHDGLIFYTLGQRQGLGVGGHPNSSGAPWYVADKDLEHNRLIVVQGRDHPRLHYLGLHAKQLYWVHGQSPKAPLKCTARTRYRQSAQKCRIGSIQDGWARVIFDQPQRAVTPGQAVVFYLEDRCLGGGTISDSFNPS